MATRLYMTSRAHAERLYGALDGDWWPGDSTRDKRGDDHWTFLLAPTKDDGGVIERVEAGNGDTKANDQPIPIGNNNGCMRWASRPLDGNGTLSGTLTVCFDTYNPTGAALALARGRVHAYISNGRGPELVKRNVLIDNQNHATAWTTTPTYREMTFNITGSVAYEAGDRLVVEPGALCSPGTAPAGDNIFEAAWGTQRMVAGVPTVQADAANGNTSPRAAWVELSDNVTFEGDSAAPANDDKADAIVIGAVPYDSPAVDSTASAGTNRAVWWKWTADRTARMVARAFGSNYYVSMRVELAAGTFVTNHGSNPVPWIGKTQAVGVFDAVEGTDYYFRLTTNFSTAGDQAAVTARNCGGETRFSLSPYLAPQTDDLFVDCQHIVVLRDGVVTNVFTGMYNDTPTGNAVDYTRRTLNDFNPFPAGGTHSDDRLYIVAFGSSPYVTILDLATLNVGEAEIDFLSNPIAVDLDANYPYNLASIIFDRSGRILLGYFGDNYSVIGSLSTPDRCRVLRVDASHADAQDGAPFPAAEAFTLDQDVGGTPYIELLADQTTLVYTSSGRKIKRFDLDSNTQLADLVELPNYGGDRPGARSVRALSPGDGSNGYLVAYGDRVLLLDSAGAILREDVPSPARVAKDLDKLEFNAAADAYWVSDQYSTYIFKFDLATGAQLAAYDLKLPPGQLSGFTVYNGFRAGVSSPPPEAVCVTAPVSIACWNPPDPTVDCANPHDGPVSAACHTPVAGPPSAACANPHAGAISGACWLPHDQDRQIVRLNETGQP